MPVYSRYSNLENGILAQQVPMSEHRYLINTASYVLEVFKMDEDWDSGPIILQEEVKLNTVIAVVVSCS